MKELFKKGDAFIWMTGVSLMFTLLMIVGLVFLIAVKGLGFFWPHDVVELRLKGDKVYLGQFAGEEVIPQFGDEKEKEYRTRLKIGNRDIYGLDFVWVKNSRTESRVFPKNAIVIERREWGNFYGFLKEINVQGKIVQGNSREAFSCCKNWSQMQIKLTEKSGKLRRERSEILTTILRS